MKTMKFSYWQLSQVLSSHLEALGLIDKDEYVTLPEIIVDKQNMVKLQKHTKTDQMELPW